MGNGCKHGNYIFEAGACCSGFLTSLLGGTKFQNMIYLSGGLRSNWQAKFANFETINPLTHGLTEQNEIQQWMIANVLKARLLVCYLEKQNPGGYNMAFEIGIARAANIPVFIVDEKQERYFEIVKQGCREFQTIEELIAAL